MSLRIQSLAIEHREARPFHMRDEVSMRTLGNDGNLYAGFAQRCQRLGQFQLSPRIRPTQNLNRAKSCYHSWLRSARRRRRGR